MRRCQTVTDSGSNTPNETAESEFSVKHYTDMEYECARCGAVETHDGVAVKIRTHIATTDDTWCGGQMFLQNRDAYWDGEIEPAEIIRYV